MWNDKSPPLWRILVGGGLVRAPLGVWFAWLALDGALFARFEDDLDSIKMLRLAFASCVALVLGGALAPLRPLQRLVGHRWSCSLGASFSGIGLLASALAVNVWQFLVASGVILAVGGALSLSPPLCLGFYHHPTRKATVAGAVNAGALLTAAVGILLSVTWLEPWFEYTGHGTGDDNGVSSSSSGGNDDSTSAPDCSGLLSNRVDICARVPFSVALLGVATATLGFLGAWCLPRSRPPSRGAMTSSRVTSTNNFARAGGGVAALVVVAADNIDDGQSHGKDDDDDDDDARSSVRSSILTTARGSTLLRRGGKHRSSGCGGRGGGDGDSSRGGSLFAGSDGGTEEEEENDWASSSVSIGSSITTSGEDGQQGQSFHSSRSTRHRYQQI